jgi:hypothetical protein
MQAGDVTVEGPNQPTKGRPCLPGGARQLGGQLDRQPRRLERSPARDGLDTWSSLALSIHVGAPATRRSRTNRSSGRRSREACRPRRTARCSGRMSCAGFEHTAALLPASSCGRVGGRRRSPCDRLRIERLTRPCLVPSPRGQARPTEIRAWKAEARRPPSQMPLRDDL